MKSIKGTETEKNLLKAFAGESEARNRYAAAGERDEWSEMYPTFAEVADREGFPAIAETFRQIATVEQHHEARYLKLAENVREGKVFAKEKEIQWKCRNCGYVHTGSTAPKVCPACVHPQAFFEELADNF